jgi:hypothetical protein
MMALKVEGEGGSYHDVGRGRSEKLKMVLNALDSPPIFSCSVPDIRYTCSFIYEYALPGTSPRTRGSMHLLASFSMSLPKIMK